MRIERHRKALSEINVTPLVDVMLVLLVIFMVTAPLLQQGIDVNLPKAKGKELSVKERINLTIKKDGRIYMNENPISLKEMRIKLNSISKLNPNVYFRADRNIPYGTIVEVISEVREAGIERLGMITEPSASIK
ncbi:MAG: biopolymer transporter ExbD [Nitrospirae bacterium]|nr:biopolymer transporter ExbD [Nitrospirota bacterium]